MKLHKLVVFRLVPIIILLSLAISTFGEDHPELNAFPAAKQGMERFVIILPHKERGEDENFKVEIIPGKIMPTDGVNLIRLGSVIEPHTLQGWGYTYYEVSGPDVAISTLMAPPEGTAMVERFVPGASLLVGYNSRLPIVVYAPKGYQIRYRVWSAPAATKEAEKH